MRVSLFELGSGGLLFFAGARQRCGFLVELALSELGQPTKTTRSLAVHAEPPDRPMSFWRVASGMARSAACCCKKVVMDGMSRQAASTRESLPGT
jgi:hypothetical protein